MYWYIIAFEYNLLFDINIIISNNSVINISKLIIQYQEMDILYQHSNIVLFWWHMTSSKKIESDYKMRNISSIRKKVYFVKS